MGGNACLDQTDLSTVPSGGPNHGLRCKLPTTRSPQSCPNHPQPLPSTPSFPPAENCVVVAEGVMGRDGVFHAAAVGFPSCEPRGALPVTAARLNFFGAPELTAEEQLAAETAELEAGEDRIVFLSDVWLDRQETFEHLGTIFAGQQGSAQELL